MGGWVANAQDQRFSPHIAHSQKSGIALKTANTRTETPQPAGREPYTLPARC